MCRHLTSVRVKGQRNPAVLAGLHLPILLRPQTLLRLRMHRKELRTQLLPALVMVVLVTDATSSDTLMKSMTELIKAQVQAMTKAPSVQSLPPLERYTGEGSQAEDDGIDRWLERFNE